MGLTIVLHRSIVDWLQGIIGGVKLSDGPTSAARTLTAVHPDQLQDEAPRRRVEDSEILRGNLQGSAPKFAVHTRPTILYPPTFRITRPRRCGCEDRTG